ncbi:MAG: DNA repair protein RecN [Chitinophagales bacterium]|nr:DNA repair protein RecN [Bacteroidota bacterium]MCB9043209.1 DNA repair protein RecN [Chitinophagales bacterium]
MLKHLYIKNYAIIDELNIDFQPDLTVITGETGAGKSILLGALSLILGKRADTSVLFRAEGKCIVEGTFAIEQYKMQAIFQEEDIDYQAITYIRREINHSGNSRAFINDTPVTLPSLKRIAQHLVNLHAQHQTLHLQDAAFQTQLLDALAKQQTLFETYTQALQHYHQISQNYKQLLHTFQQQNNDKDYCLFQINELEALQIRDVNEQQILETQLKQIQHAEQILKNLHETQAILEDETQGILSNLTKSVRNLQQISSWGTAYEQIAERIQSVHLELEDIAQEITYELEQVNFQPEQALQMQQRLDNIIRIEKKYEVNDLASLVEKLNSLQNHLQQIDKYAENLAIAEKNKQQAEAKVIDLAKQLSKGRKAVIPQLESNIQHLLQQMEMPQARVLISVTPLAHFTDNGMDEIAFLFSANKGSEPIEIRKVASGGELSRLMLALQTLVAQTTALPTLVFDEIDTGISGEVAKKVGVMLQQLARTHQVICITHLPQIASKGSDHLQVYKSSDQTHTFTRLRRLDSPQARIEEIATMLSGVPPGQSAIENARELLEAEG